MSSIEEAFKAKIVALATDAGSNVYREVIEQEPDSLPVISFTRTGAPPMVRLLETSVPVLNRANFRVEIIADSYADAESVASDLKAGLDGFRGAITVTASSPQFTLTVLRCAMVFQGDAAYSDGDKTLKITQQDYELTYR
jgi:hypothetical protein